MYTLYRERARGARHKNDRQPHPLLFGRWGGGVTKNLVEYLVEWPPKFEKHNTGFGVTSCKLESARVARAGKMIDSLHPLLISCRSDIYSALRTCMRKTSNISNIKNGGKFSLLKRAFTCRRLNEIPYVVAVQL